MHAIGMGGSSTIYMWGIQLRMLYILSSSFKCTCPWSCQPYPWTQPVRLYTEHHLTWRYWQVLIPVSREIGYYCTFQVIQEAGRITDIKIINHLSLICVFIFLWHHMVQRLEGRWHFGDVMGDLAVSGVVIRHSTAKILESVCYIDGGICIAKGYSLRL